MQNHCFPELTRKLGFGFMRLPMQDGQVDLDETTRMVDAFMQAGFNYFDTAHGYLDGQSETALRHCLTSRYPREAFVLTNKLSGHLFRTREDIRPLFRKQLEACGVDYFDFYLMHSQDREEFELFQSRGAYETGLELKNEGKIRHFGISFHDTADVLDRILAACPEIEVVQIQLNYADYDDPSIQSRLCYEVCRKHRKPVMVMEPVKGGALVNLPGEAQAIFDTLGGSPASYAIRFAAGFEGVVMVLSGMSNLDMVVENTAYMSDFQPLSPGEQAAIAEVCEIFKAQNLIGCTACRYCTEVCPKHIAIPELFACMNAKKLWNIWTSAYYYNSIHTTDGNKASDCVKCGKCEGICPQHLPIRDLLETVAGEFEKKE